MKVCNLLKCMLMVLFIGMGTIPSMAQKNIDKLLEEIERRDDASVNSVTKRNPKTRKITSVVKSFSLTDAKMTQRLIEAFEKDEELRKLQTTIPNAGDATPNQRLETYGR